MHFMDKKIVSQFSHGFIICTCFCSKVNAMACHPLTNGFLLNICYMLILNIFSKVGLITFSSLGLCTEVLLFRFYVYWIWDNL